MPFVGAEILIVLFSSGYRYDGLHLELKKVTGFVYFAKAAAPPRIFA